MSRRITLSAAAALFFVLLATANSGGYRYGISDQAFYLPAMAKSLVPALFPRDAPVLEAQMRLWLGDNITAALAGRATPADLPIIAGALYGLGLLLLAAGIVFVARGLGGSWLAVCVALTAATLRHHITKTGANTLEGYFHPRMLAYGLGVLALGLVLRRRFVSAGLCVGVMALIHTTAALWFGGAVLAAAIWTIDRRAIWLVAGGAGIVALGLAVLGSRMDASWLAAVAEKDYLFPSAWPLHAWALNLGYPIVLWLIYRRRVHLGRLAAGEPALVVGLLVLVAGFLVSVPLSAAKIALAVQLQITRVFWVLDAFVLIYVAWWLIDDAGARRSAAWRTAAAALVLAFSVGRGYYVLVIEGARPLVRWTLPAGDWTDAMAWLQTQPVGLNVLADPGHAWRYGSSVRLAALRDTVLERTKDTALAMYDRSVAQRVLERIQALEGFEDFTRDKLLALGARYQADVVVLERTRTIDLPVLYQNQRFVVYALRP